MPAEPPPSPDGPPLLGDTLAYARSPLDAVDAAVEACGRVVRMRVLGLGEFYVLAHPDHIERALVGDRETFRKSSDFRDAFGENVFSAEGERWRRHRNPLDEFFAPERVRSYADRMVETIEARLDRWPDRGELSLHGEMSDLAIENFFATVFDRALDPDGDRRLRRAADDLTLWFKPTSFVLPRWVPTPARRRFRSARETMGTEVRRLLREREREGPEPGGDLLSTLVALRAADDTDLTDGEIVDQVAVLVVAGYDTTALLLTYALHQLGSHDAVRERFHAELETVLGGARPGPSNLEELSVTRRVIEETLRAFPPIHTIPRETTRPVEIDGYRLRADTRTHLSVWRVHRDAAFWDDPDEWRPARWRDTGPRERGYAFVPFGAGPRACVGRRFARVEAALVLALVGQRYRLDPERGLAFEPMATNQPAHPVPVSVQRR